MGKQKGPFMIEKIIEYKSKDTSIKKIAKFLNISKNTVKAHLRKLCINTAKDAELTLKAGFYLNSKETKNPKWSENVNWHDVNMELEKGYTLNDYWEKLFMNKLFNEISYIRFWREYRRRYPKVNISYHREYPPGERAECDYKGKEPLLHYIDIETGEIIQCELFGMILPHSQLFYSKATPSQKQEYWFEGIEDGYTYFGGVSSLLIVDNAKTLVDKASFFDPDVNKKFYNFCDHMSVTPMPARPRKPKDKSLVEITQGVFWRWIKPRLKEKTPHSIEDLNKIISYYLEIFNNRIQKKYGKSRRTKFEDTEKNTLKSLPKDKYEGGLWKKALLHSDSHVQVNNNFYSAPYNLRSKILNIRITTKNIEIFDGCLRVALHSVYPIGTKGRYRTDSNHLPEKHKSISDFTTESLIVKASKIGNATKEIVDNLINKSSHPLQHVRKVQKILKLSSVNGAIELERASQLIIDYQITTPKVSDYEKFLNFKGAGKVPDLKIIRNNNPNLRGQNHWQ